MFTPVFERLVAKFRYFCCSRGRSLVAVEADDFLHLRMVAQLNNQQRHTNPFLYVTRYVCKCLGRFLSGWLQSVVFFLLTLLLAVFCWSSHHKMFI